MAFNFQSEGDRGVMSAAMQAGNIKAAAQDKSGINAVAGQLSGWADDVMKEGRQKRLEARAEGRQIAKEGRAAEAEVAKRETQLGYLADETSPEAIAAKQEADESAAKIDKMKSETAYNKSGRGKVSSKTGRKVGQLTDVDKSRMKRLTASLDFLDPEDDKEKIVAINRAMDSIEARANMTDEQLAELKTLSEKGSATTSNSDTTEPKPTAPPLTKSTSFLDSTPSAPASPRAIRAKQGSSFKERQDRATSEGLVAIAKDLREARKKLETGGLKGRQLTALKGRIKRLEEQLKSPTSP